MRQIVLPGKRADSEHYLVDDTLRHYLIDVRRMRTGDTFDAIDETGTRFLASILSDTPNATEILLAEAKEPSQIPSEPGIRIALVQALPKGQKFDLIVRQATELGTALIVPVITEHCVGADWSEKTDAKLARRQRIIREALQQSGSSILTEIVPTVPLSELDQVLIDHGFDSEQSERILFHEAAQQSKRSLHESLLGKKDRVVIAIGPEGGISSADLQVFARMGFSTFHVEGPIMRVDTAAVFAISAIRILMLERALWKM
jgi:16S rRNA (uracil1498-N3)-methyltransferase